MENNFIPVYQPSLTGNEKKYVNQCLDSTWISSKGEFINKFEKAFAEKINIKYSSTTSNGTTALHLAIVALNIGPGDEVIVPTLTYIASVNTITYSGATPVFVDSESTNWQIDPKKIEEKINAKTKAIMLVHLYGSPCDIDAIMPIAKKYNLLIIEDCAEAFGTKYKGKHVGTFGDISTFSFFGNKTITTGEGGMVVTNNPDLIQKIQKIKSQGLAANIEYWHDSIGFNYRMTNICAAIGLAQLEQADKFLAKKKQIVGWYNDALKDLPITHQPEVENTNHSYWMYSILVKDLKQRDELRKHLKEHNIETRPLFNPIHLMPIYLRPNESYPIAEDLSLRGMNLPSFPLLSKEQVYFIANQIRTFILKD